MSEVLRDNPRGLLYVTEEFDSWVGGIDCYRASGAASRDRGEWLRLYNGGPHQVDRVKRGSFFVPNWGASVLSATTPTALLRLAPKLPNDGLLQWFMPVLLRPPVDRDEKIDATYERIAFEERLRELFAIGPQIINLSAQAADTFTIEERRIRELVEASEAMSEPFAAHMGKHAAMLARVALTFHLAQGDRGDLQAATMKACGRLHAPRRAPRAHLVRRAARKWSRDGSRVTHSAQPVGRPRGGDLPARHHSRVHGVPQHLRLAPSSSHRTARRRRLVASARREPAGRMADPLGSQSARAHPLRERGRRTPPPPRTRQGEPARGQR